MPTDVIMPALGVAQKTGKLLKWLKAEGRPVIQGEPLMEIETDKATLEIEAPASGVLTRVTAAPGDEIPVGNTIALILAPGETAPAEPHPSPEEKKSAGKRPAMPEPAPSRAVAAPAAVHGRPLASPAARRLARERGVDLGALKGSGPGGSILARDILPTSIEGAPELPAGEILPLSAMRRIIAERMTRSKQSAPHFYLSVDIDMERVERLREELKAGSASPAPSINDFILSACARALRAYPSVNAGFGPQGIVLHPDIHLGLAVALDDGLVVPVIRHADRLGLSELAAESRALIDKAQRKKLFPLDYEGGTFTVSNLGMLGVDSFTAIINPPQSAILAVGRVAPRVVAEQGMFAIKSLMTATLSADHRVIDGAVGARFLGAIKEHLEKGEF